MKQIFSITICIVALICISTQVQAQRYLPRQVGIEVKGGMVDGFHFAPSDQEAYYFSVGVSSYTQTRDRIFATLEFLTKYHPYKHLKLPVSQYTAEGGYLYTFLSDRGRNIFLSVGGSAMLGYETVNNGNRLLFDGAQIADKDRFVYGLAAKLEAEIFITDRIIFLVELKERCLFGSSAGKFHMQFGIGMKFIIH